MWSVVLIGEELTWPQDSYNKAPLYPVEVCVHTGQEEACKFLMYSIKDIHKSFALMAKKENPDGLETRKPLDSGESPVEVPIITVFF